MQHLQYGIKSLSKFAITFPYLVLKSISGRRIISLVPSLSATTPSSPPSDCPRLRFAPRTPCQISHSISHHHHTTAVLRPFCGTTRVSWCQKRTSGPHGAREDQQRRTHRTIWLGATPSKLSSAHLHHPTFYRPDALPATQPTVSKQSNG